MAKDTNGTAEQEKPAPQPKTVKMVQYLFAPNRRGLTSGDFAQAGVPDRQDVWWDRENNWMVPLDSLNLPEQVAAQILTRDNGFQIIEVDAEAQA